jgi:predicted HTH transcriptional regulator
MIAKPIDFITEADPQSLINDSVPESKRIEYKRELPDASEQGKVKFLKSVTAFANTQGGDLIYGMEAEDGIPKQLQPLSMLSIDQVLQRLEQLCASGTDPRLIPITRP